MIHNYGVFAKKRIKQGELIAAWGGMIWHKDTLSRAAQKKPHIVAHPIAIYEDLFLIPLDFRLLEASEHFNHSCNPNAGIKGQILLVARRDIRAGEEICFDYETTEMTQVNGLPFKCHCLEKKCRKKISGNSWKDKKFQKNNRGYFSWYLQEKIDKYNN